MMMIILHIKNKTKKFNLLNQIKQIQSKHLKRKNSYLMIQQIIILTK